MEKHKQTQRQKGVPKRGESSPTLPGDDGHLETSVPTEGLALGHLSNLADSARKTIIKSGTGSENSAATAQAELLISRNKIEEVRRRIQTGYYGQPDVIGQIIDRLSDDLRP